MAFCYPGRVIVYTLGHSTLALDEFLALLRAHAITGIADVRRFPASRRHPHFGREALAAALERASLCYDWLPGLGGRRRPRGDSPHTAWRNEGFRGYADHMQSTEFADALDALVRLGETRPTAIMCAEALPYRCHRQLVADALVARGVEVRHVIGAGTPGRHALTPFARVVGHELIYDRGGPSRLPGT